MPVNNPERIVTLDVTNYRGERSLRAVVPIRLFFDSSRYHPIAQWLLAAHEVKRDVERTFALVNIHAWMSMKDEDGAARCALPPPGWMCSRAAGHDGPCAARPVP